jgi:hypothetical protein
MFKAHMIYIFSVTYLNAESFQKEVPAVIVYNYLHIYRISLYLLSLKSVVLGECADPGGYVMKQQ